MSFSFGAYDETDNTVQVAWLLAICRRISKCATTFQVTNVRRVQAQTEAGLLSKGSHVPPKGHVESTLGHTLEGMYQCEHAIYKKPCNRVAYCHLSDETNEVSAN